MGIELALYDSRPPGHRKRPVTELRLSLGHGDALAAALLARCTTEAQRAAVRDLADVLAKCAGTPGSWLWFIGD
ncbi:hypothetical protein OG535_09205 [Kitasatospora sp. NBC_00085]|uniref:hypothetical protein n=1 Tax=unclassified Kitasatospora TaxID=2633591 RepID=UPI00324B8B4D